MEKCPEHSLLESRLEQQKKEYQNLLSYMKALQTNFDHRMNMMLEKFETMETALQANFDNKINSIHSKIDIIEKRLIGDLDLGTPGWITHVADLQKETKLLKESDLALNTTITKLLPWFAAFKWMVFIITPLFITGASTFVIGLITGKIKIIM
jgi:predicted  nucleic acid-binding Zn-ribbon protein